MSSPFIDSGRAVVYAGPLDSVWPTSYVGSLGRKRAIRGGRLNSSDVKLAVITPYDIVGYGEKPLIKIRGDGRKNKVEKRKYKKITKSHK